MNSIVIVNGFGLTANVGDHALLVATANVVRSAYPHTPIHVVPWQSPTPEMRRRFLGLVRSLGPIDLTNPILPANSRGRGFPSSSLISKAEILAWTAWANVRSEVRSRFFFLNSTKSSFHLLRSSDLVVLRGCNIVQRGWDLRTMATLRRVTFPLLMAQRMGVPTALLNISIGPVEHPLARHMIKRVVEGADYVSVRELLTIEYLRGLAQRAPILSADTAFAIPYCLPDKAMPDLMVLGINMLSRGEYLTAVCNSSSRYDRVIRRLVDELDNLMEVLPSLKLIAIPHEMDGVDLTSDLVSLRMLVNMLKHPERVEVLDQVTDPESVIRAYSRCGLAVGMRFHGYVLSSLASTPMLGIDLGSQKTRGVARSLGMADRMIDLGQEGNLVKQVSAALEFVDELRAITGQKASELRQTVLGSFADFAQSFGIGN